MIYGYIRKSTKKQSFEHMEYEISDYAAKHNIKIDVWVEETISSRKPLSKRQLGQLLEKLQPNDILITSELSRISQKCAGNLFNFADLLKQELPSYHD